MSATLQSINVGGQVIWVEVNDVPVASPAVAQGKFANTSAQDAAQNAVEAIGQVDFARTLSALVGPIHEALKDLAPEEASVEIGLGLKGTVGIFVASSEANASVKISAKWKFNPKSA